MPAAVISYGFPNRDVAMEWALDNLESAEGWIALIDQMWDDIWRGR